MHAASATETAARPHTATSAASHCTRAIACLLAGRVCVDVCAARCASADQSRMSLNAPRSGEGAPRDECAWGRKRVRPPAFAPPPTLATKKREKRRAPSGFQPSRTRRTGTPLPSRRAASLLLGVGALSHTLFLVRPHALRFGGVGRTKGSLLAHTASFRRQSGANVACITHLVAVFCSRAPVWLDAGERRRGRREAEHSVTPAAFCSS